MYDSTMLLHPGRHPYQSSGPALVPRAAGTMTIPGFQSRTATRR